jgi:hypothetical protein
LAALFASSRAFAQTTTTTTSTLSIQIAGQAYPERYLNYGLSNQQDLGQSTRPQGLNPFGISYQDCIDDQTLLFPLLLSGFDGQSLEVWATVAGDCTNDQDRGNPGPANCWLLSSGANTTGLVSGASEQINVPVRVQDIVAWQNLSPSPTSYVRAGPSACNAQPSFTPVSITLYFIPVLSDLYQAGNNYQYNVNTGLVGPEAPLNVGIADGDTLFIVNWTPNNDSVTIGYNLYIDPPIGTTPDASSSVLSLVCDTPDGTTATAVTSASISLDASGEPDGADDAAELTGDGASVASDAQTDAQIDATIGDATVSDATSSDGASSMEASCHYAYISGAAGNPASGTCNDSNLTAGTTQDAATEFFEEAGVDGEVVTTGTNVSGGISQVASKYAVPVSEDGLNASGEGTGTFTIKGLTNGVTYTVVVSAVDAFGNVGPPSNEACDYPAPVNDFWTLYREAGGQAGGLCALEAVGAPVSSTVAFGAVGAICIGLARRRRRGRR